MKKWKSPSGVTYRRLTKGIVFVDTWGRARFYRMVESVWLETSEDLTHWFRAELVDSHPLVRAAREAIAALWPAPAKDRLWRRVARAMGELCFMLPDSQFPFEHELTTRSFESARRLLDFLIVRRDAKIGDPLDRQAIRLIAKLEEALAAWEAAE